MAYSSHEEGDKPLDIPDQYAEQFDNFLSKRNGSMGKLDKITGPKKLRRLPSHTEMIRREKLKGQRRHTLKHERQKGRLDARAFKELDTTLQVLGIDERAEDSSVRLTASPHVPTLPAASRSREMSKDFSYLEVSFSRRLSLESSTTIEKGLGQGKPEGHRPELHRSPAHKSDSLEDKRRKWHADLDNLLEGHLDQDDMQVALHLASGKAGDLKDQLLYWHTPPDATWPAREERIRWLQQALTQLRDITTGLQQHGVNWHESEHIKLYLLIMGEVESEILAMASMCCDAIKDGLQALKGSSPDTRIAFDITGSLIRLIIVAIKERKVMKEESNQFVTQLGELASDLALSLMEATADFQGSLLQPSAIILTGKEVSAHEVSVRCSQLQIAWQKCADIAAGMSLRCPEQATSVNRARCKLMLRAANFANEMQRNLPWFEDHAQQDSTSGSESSACAQGVWGLSISGDLSGSSGVGDEDLQAQGWLPACLTSLLAQAQIAANAVLRPAEGSSSTTEDYSPGTGLMDELSDALYELALTNLHRVASMCVSPSGLACWALELLEEQACQAVVFVRDLDKSVLGRGKHGLDHYLSLRAASDVVVNAILRVRRLLKQKRSANVGDGMPRPLPGLRWDAQQSSLTKALSKQKEKAKSPQKTSPGREPPAAPNSGQPPPANGWPSTSAKKEDPEEYTKGHSRESSCKPNGDAASRGRRIRGIRSGATDTPSIPEHGEMAIDSAVALPNTNGLDYREAGSDEGGPRNHNLSNANDGRSEPGDVKRIQPPAEGDGDLGQPGNNLFADPFAEPKLQQQGLMRNPSVQSPLAVFSPANSSRSSNTLMPAGSAATIRFGAFSPTQSSMMPSPREGFVSPFAGAPLLTRTSTIGSSQASASNGVATPSTRTRGDQASPAVDCQPRDSTDSGRLPLHDRLSSNRDAIHSNSEWNGHPMSDPTNGYHHLHSHPLPYLRQNPEPLTREESIENLERLRSNNHTPRPNSSRTSFSEADNTAESSEQAFTLPWAGEPFWQIKWENLKHCLVTLKGHGSYGAVWEAHYHSAPVAVKVIKIDTDPAALQSTLTKFKQEVDLQRRLSIHPCIVRFLGACCHIPHAPGMHEAYNNSDVTLAIVMELCGKGSLYDLISKAREVSQLPPEVLSNSVQPRNAKERTLKAGSGFRFFGSWPIRLKIMRNISAALEFMHSEGYIHRDLTSCNVLVTDGYEAKVADFNLSRALKDEMVPHSDPVNSAEWAAPEKLDGKKPYNGRAADVFSLGVVFWEIITLMPPWKDVEPEDTSSLEDGWVPGYIHGEEEHLTQGKITPFHITHEVIKGNRLEFPEVNTIRPGLPQVEQFIDLAKHCWHQDPKARPNMTEICQELKSIEEAMQEQVRRDRERRRVRQG